MLSKLTYLVMGALIAYFIVALLAETGHTALCQREIDRILEKVDDEIQPDSTKIKVKFIRAWSSEDLLLLSIPANRRLKIRLDRQGIDEPQKSTIRELAIQSRGVGQLVALKIAFDDTQATGPSSIRIETSELGKLNFEVPDFVRLRFLRHGRVASGKFPDLFATQQKRGRMIQLDAWKDLNIFMVEDEILLNVAETIRPNGDKVMYGVSLSTEP